MGRPRKQTHYLIINNGVVDRVENEAAAIAAIDMAKAGGTSVIVIRGGEPVEFHTRTVIEQPEPKPKRTRRTPIVNVDPVLTKKKRNGASETVTP